jgi:hypothetical protein
VLHQGVRASHSMKYTICTASTCSPPTAETETCPSRESLAFGALPWNTSSSTSPRLQPRLDTAQLGISEAVHTSSITQLPAAPPRVLLIPQDGLRTPRPSPSKDQAAAYSSFPAPSEYCTYKAEPRRAVGLFRFRYWCVGSCSLCEKEL